MSACSLPGSPRKRTKLHFASGAEAECRQARATEPGRRVMTRKQRRFSLIGAALGILALAVALVLNALKDSIVFFRAHEDREWLRRVASFSQPTSPQAPSRTLRTRGGIDSR
jgi:hypothetical protein